MREEKPGVIIVFPISHVISFLQAIEGFHKVDFCKSLFCIDINDFQENVPVSGSCEFRPGVARVIVFEQIRFSDLGEEFAAL